MAGVRQRARAKAAGPAPKRMRASQRKPKITVSSELRRVCALLYIQDKEGRSGAWHWENGPAHSAISLSKFLRDWFDEGNWYEQRIEYWRDVQYRTLEQMKERDVARVVVAVDRLDDMADAIDKMLQPKRGKDGKILYDENGLPCFHLALPPYDRMVKAALDIDARRDHYGERIVDHVLKTHGADSDGVLVTEGAVLDMGDSALTPEEARAAARWLLLHRHKQLAADAQHDSEVQQEDGDG